MAKKTSRSKAALISQYMAKIGSKGGLTKGTTKARDPEIMRDIAKKAWAKKKASPRPPESDPPPEL